MEQFRKRFTYANLVSSICLFLLLGGVARRRLLLHRDPRQHDSGIRKPHPQDLGGRFRRAVQVCYRHVRLAADVDFLHCTNHFAGRVADP